MNLIIEERCDQLPMYIYMDRTADQLHKVTYVTM